VVSQAKTPGKKLKRDPKFRLCIVWPGQLIDTPETLRTSGALQREDWPVVYCSAALRGELWLSEEEVLGGNLSFLLGSPNSDQDRARCDQGAWFQ
jgi:hypothetical protein